MESRHCFVPSCYCVRIPFAFVLFFLLRSSFFFRFVFLIQVDWSRFAERSVDSFHGLPRLLAAHHHGNSYLYQKFGHDRACPMPPPHLANGSVQSDGHVAGTLDMDELEESKMKLLLERANGVRYPIPSSPDSPSAPHFVRSLKQMPNLLRPSGGGAEERKSQVVGQIERMSTSSIVGAGAGAGAASSNGSLPRPFLPQAVSSSPSSLSPSFSSSAAAGGGGGGGMGVSAGAVSRSGSGPDSILALASALSEDEEVDNLMAEHDYGYDR